MDEDFLHASPRNRASRWLIFFTLILAGLFFVPESFAAVDTAEITASPGEIEEGETSEFTVDIKDLGGEPLSTMANVVLSLSGSATLGVDYEIAGDLGSPISLEFPQFIGSSSQTITVKALNDDVVSEGQENVIITIAACDWVEPDVDAGECPTGSSATVTIIDTTPLPVATIEATDPDASKDGPDSGQYTVELNSPAPAPGVQVNYSAGGTAVPGQDYSALPGSVLIPEGQTTTTIPVNPLLGIASGETTLVVTLEAGSGYEVGQPASATVTIAEAVFVISIDSGGEQVAATGLTLEPFVVKATASGVPVAGVSILWSLEKGEGTLSNQESVTDEGGLASSTLTPTSDGEFVVKAQIEDAGDSVEFTALFNPLSSLTGLTGNQREIAETLDALCPRLAAIGAEGDLSAGEQDLLTQCQNLQQSTTEDPSAAFEGVVALTPNWASTPLKMATQLTGAQLDNLQTRMSALRRGARGISLGNLTVSIDGQSVNGGTVADLLGQLGDTGGGASADEAGFERFGIFVNGNIDWGDKDQTDNEDGFDFQTLGITAGVDYRFLEGLVLGVAFGYGGSDVDIDAGRGNFDLQAWSAMLYGTYYATDHFYLEGSAFYGWGDYDQTRIISYSLLGGSREAKADYSGTQSAFMLGAGYDFIRGSGMLDVYGRLRYAQVDIDGYSEKGASGLDLDIDSQEGTSFKSILGVNYTRSFSTAKAVLLPQGWLEWTHEFESGDDAVTGVFANDPSQIAFALATDTFDSDYVRLGLGLGAQFGQGKTAFVSYEAAIGLNNYAEHTASLGVRLEF